MGRYIFLVNPIIHVNNSAKSITCMSGQYWSAHNSQLLNFWELFSQSSLYCTFWHCEISILGRKLSTQKQMNFTMYCDQIFDVLCNRVLPSHFDDSNDNRLLFIHLVESLGHIDIQLHKYDSYIHSFLNM